MSPITKLIKRSRKNYPITLIYGQMKMGSRLSKIQSLLEANGKQNVKIRDYSKEE
jgi:hypothetical protein